MTEHLVLQFSTSTARVSALIRYLTQSPYSHVDIVLPDGNLLGASDQGAHGRVIAGNSCGVAIRPPDYQAFGIRRQMVIKTEKADAVIAAVMEEIGKPFDHSALKQIMTDKIVRDWRENGMWFCSELVAHGLEKGKFFKRPIIMPKNRITPPSLILCFNDRDEVVNYETFQDLIPGLVLGPHEI